jgi:hypothetical protein
MLFGQTGIQGRAEELGSVAVHIVGISDLAGFQITTLRFVAQAGGERRFRMRGTSSLYSFKTGSTCECFFGTYIKFADSLALFRLRP